MDPVTSNIQANQHLKNENVLWVKRPSMTRRAVVTHLKFEIKLIIKLREKKSRVLFFGGGGKGESNLGGIDFYWYLLVKTSF